MCICMELWDVTEKLLISLTKSLKSGTDIATPTYCMKHTMTAGLTVTYGSFLQRGAFLDVIKIMFYQKDGVHNCPKKVQNDRKIHFVTIKK